MVGWLNRESGMAEEVKGRSGGAGDKWMCSFWGVGSKIEEK